MWEEIITVRAYRREIRKFAEVFYSDRAASNHLVDFLL